MKTIKCPKCGEPINLDKSDYDALLNELETAEIEKRVQSQTKLIEQKLNAQYELKVSKANTSKEAEISDLKAVISVLEQKLKNADETAELAISRALKDVKEELNDKEKEIIVLNSKVEASKKDASLEAQKLKESYEYQLSMKDSEIERWKNYRVGDSTKDIGENLEKYCKEAFEEIRATAYPRAYFEKDNIASEGTKGDFIFRDYTEDGIELVSIMFDMKTEKDTTEKKKTNESHLSKLDSDRTKKGCEYAVLVSTLEEDSKVYNKGIVDMSYKYPKTFVVRPQFFLAIIGLIRSMALSNLPYRRSLIEYQNENIDVSRFEETVKAVMAKVNNDYAWAGKLYDGVEKMVDDMIKKLTDLKDNFRKSAGHLLTATHHVEDLSIRKLTRKNPTMKAKFDALKGGDDDAESE